MSDEKQTFLCSGCWGINRVLTAKLGDQPKCGRCQTALDLTNHPLAATDEQLERVVRAAPTPVLVDFWAPWCGPCRMVAPMVERLASERAGRLIVLKVNTDEQQRVFGGLRARGIPTFALYRDGQLVKKQEGAMALPQLQAFVG